MSSIKNDIVVSPSDLFAQVGNVVGTVPYNTFTPELGVRGVTGDGREFRYVQAGGVSLVAGKLQQSAAIVPNHQNLASSTATAGAFSITVTLGNTAATANQYSGGYVIINAGTGAGQTLRIAGHPAANALATLVLTLEDAVVITTSSSDSKSCLYPNLYAGVIVCPTTITGQPVGVPLINLTTLYYGWIQVKGAASVLNQGTTAVGLGLAPSASVAGALATVAATTQQVGVAMQAGVDGEYRLVDIQLN